MQIGIVGLPNSGKTTLFNALSKSQAEIGIYPFTTIDSNVGVVEVPDGRLDKLASVLKPPKIVLARIKYVDIAGLVEGASKGEGLGNRFLGHIREVDGLLHLVRCFGEDIPAVGKDEPQANIEIVNLEIMLADMQIVEKRLEKVSKSQVKAGQKDYLEEFELLKKAKEQLEKESYLAIGDLSGDEKNALQNIGIISAKPVIMVANISEGQLQEDGCFSKVDEVAKKLKVPALKISAKLEAELADLPDEEAKEFLESYGLSESGLKAIVNKTYELLGLITFYTVLSGEVRAWPIKAGTSAFQAAGNIHTDMQKGFIKAEVISWDDLVALGSLAAAKERGKVRLEGKDYIVQDGDVITFRFKV